MVYGLDYSTEPIRWATLERARDNDAVATLPTKLVYDPKGGTPGVLVSVPVYAKGTSRTTIPDRRRNLTGFVVGIFDLGACLNSRCSIPSESDSSLGYEQVFSPLGYRSDAASAAACAGFRAARPCLAVYRRSGAGEPRSEGNHGQLCERSRAAAV